MISGYPFISGKQQPPAPLHRYLPSIPEGVVTAWLKTHSSEISSNTQSVGSLPWILDPFGADPRLVVEIAQNGYRVLVAANNPILRLLIEYFARPPGEAELRSTLADLASEFKSGERLELHIKSLYQSECQQCKSIIQVEAFLWDRGADIPTGKIYTCPSCGDSGERAISQDDLDRLARIGPSGMHRARALERVTSIDDPDRKHAEEALDSYLPRSIYVLITLINKLESLPDSRRNLSALLLAIFDQANSLWPYPNVRARPRLLTIPTHFRENNIWTALENSIHLWMANTEYQPVPMTIWPEMPPLTGGICLFEGKVRDLFQMPDGSDEQERIIPPGLEIGAVITALPRPNQAFWTLSALWTGWLFGKETAAPIKNVLRRRRYDWSWHCTALQAAFESFENILAPGTPVLTLIGELESGFLTAALTAGGLVGLEIKSIALRNEIDQAQINWQVSEKKLLNRLTSIEIFGQFRQIARDSGIDCLKNRNEPSLYTHIISSAIGDALSKNLFLTQNRLNPGDFQTEITTIMQQVYHPREGFRRFGGSEYSMEVGQWWIQEEKLGKIVGAVSEVKQDLAPLSDRVEIAIVEYLYKNPGCSSTQIESRICEIFPGLLTPEMSLVETCISSYAEVNFQESNLWKLRDEDHPQNRRLDLLEMRDLISRMGKKMGFQTKTMIDKNNPIVCWQTHGEEKEFLFYIQASALLSRFLLNPEHLRNNSYLVFPGGRANLLDYKIKHDPRLELVINSGVKFIKFRNLRRQAENESLTIHSFDALLSGDAITRSETQIPLL
jgi:hypothetical protein